MGAAGSKTPSASPAPFVSVSVAVDVDDVVVVALISAWRFVPPPEMRTVMGSLESGMVV